MPCGDFSSQGRPKMKRPLGTASARGRAALAAYFDGQNRGISAAAALHPLVVAENRPRTMMPSEAGRATASSSPDGRFSARSAGIPARRRCTGRWPWPAPVRPARRRATSRPWSRGGDDGRVLQFAKGVLAADLGLLQLIAHLLRAQAGCLGQGGRIVQLAEGVLAAGLRLLQFGGDLGAALGLRQIGGLAPAPARPAKSAGW